MSLEGNKEVVILLSGGKDSLYAAYLLKKQGYTLRCIGNIYPEDISETTETDSYMYQTVGCETINRIAQCLQLPLIRRKTKAKCVNSQLKYEETKEDEVEDLFHLLDEVKKKYPNVRYVSSGAIASNYQKNRVESVCRRLNLTSLSPLWGLEQEQLLKDMVTNNFHAIIIKAASFAFSPPNQYLGMTLEEILEKLEGKKFPYEINYCGEGGEYETIVLDCPLFIEDRLKISNMKIVELNEYCSYAILDIN
ncbi:hypothetical protein SNEBB_003888 [Seison nebaliae]|nr:hypothetical protein SNEBB_003888 [Seison nebaliae]